MPKPRSIFIDSGESFNSVCRRLDSILGNLVPNKEDPANKGIRRYDIIGIELLLFDGHELEEDCGIQFERFRFQLELVPQRQSIGFPGFDAMYTSLSEFLASRMSKLLDCRVIIVENLQKIVDEYRPGGD